MLPASFDQNALLFASYAEYVVVITFQKESYIIYYFTWIASEIDMFNGSLASS